MNIDVRFCIAHKIDSVAAVDDYYSFQILALYEISLQSQESWLIYVTIGCKLLVNKWGDKLHVYCLA